MKDIRVHWLNTIDSTNLEAFRNIEKASDITVWGADFQTAGRGQRGNKWESEKGLNLTFSILFKPLNVKAVNQFLISQITTLGILSYLQTHNIIAKIKWPNDIYVNDKKLCGILIENIISSDNLSASIVGIGVNLNQKEFRSDAPNPTSLILEVSENSNGNVDTFIVRDEFDKLLRHIISFYEMLDSDSGRDYIESEYHNSLYRLEECHQFVDLRDNSLFEGRILGVNDKALLKVELSEGPVKCFAFKEIKYIL